MFCHMIFLMFFDERTLGREAPGCCRSAIARVQQRSCCSAAVFLPQLYTSHFQIPPIRYTMLYEGKGVIMADLFAWMLYELNAVMRSSS